MHQCMADALAGIPTQWTGFPAMTLKYHQHHMYYSASCNRTTTCAIEYLCCMVGCVPWHSKVDLHATSLCLVRNLSVFYILWLPPFNHHHHIATPTTKWYHHHVHSGIAQMQVGYLRQWLSFPSLYTPSKFECKSLSFHPPCEESRTLPSLWRQPIHSYCLKLSRRTKVKSLCLYINTYNTMIKAWEARKTHIVELV